MIPEEAIEAAARAYFEDCGYAEWDHLAEGVQAAVRVDMRAALEAAAPHMMAGALEDLADAADDPSAEDMDTYFIDQADVGRWIRTRAAALRPTP